MKKLICIGLAVLAIASITAIIVLIKGSKFPGDDELIERAITVFVAKNTPDGFVVGEVLFEETGEANVPLPGERVAMLGDSRWASRSEGPREVIVILWREHSEAGISREEIPILQDGKLVGSRRTKADLVRELSEKKRQQKRQP